MDKALIKIEIVKEYPTGSVSTREEFEAKDKESAKEFIDYALHLLKVEQ